MPAVPIIAVALGASGALAVGGAALATAIGIGTVSTAAATAIGAAAFSGAVTAVQGGKVSDVLKSAVIGGVTSYAGSAIASSVAGSVSSSAISSGASETIAKAMGAVVGNATAGAISSGTAALLYDKDPLEALLKGGLSAAMSTGVGMAVDGVLNQVPGLTNPQNATEAALQRATRAALGTAVLTGGNPMAVQGAVLNSFIGSALMKTGGNLSDTSSQVRGARSNYESVVNEYQNNVNNQSEIVNQYNSLANGLETERVAANDLIKRYETLASNYNNYDSYMSSQGYALTSRGYDGEGNYAGDYYAKQVWVPTRRVSGYDENGFYTEWDAPPGYQLQAAPESMSKDAILAQAKSVDAEAVKAVNAFNDRYNAQKSQLDDLAIKLNELKEKLPEYETNIADAKTELETSIAKFQESESKNAAIVQKQLNDLQAVADKHREVFGADATDDEMMKYATGTAYNNTGVPGDDPRGNTLDNLNRLNDLQSISERNRVLFGDYLSADKLKQINEGSLEEYTDRQDTATFWNNLYKNETGRDMTPEQRRVYFHMSGSPDLESVYRDDLTKYRQTQTQELADSTGVLDGLLNGPATQVVSGDTTTDLQAIEDLRNQPSQADSSADSALDVLGKDMVATTADEQAKSLGWGSAAERDLAATQGILDPSMWKASLEVGGDLSKYGNMTHVFDDGSSITIDGEGNVIDHKEAADDRSVLDVPTKEDGPLPQGTEYDSETNTYTQVFDDGSSVTVDAEGNIVSHAEATDNKVPGGTTQVFDDGSSITTDEEGNIVSHTEETDSKLGETAQAAGGQCSPGWEYDAETNTCVRVFDDGSSITTDQEGNIVDFQEATDTPYVPEPTRRRTSVRTSNIPGGAGPGSRIPGLGALGMGMGMGVGLGAGLPQSAAPQAVPTAKPLISPLGISDEKSKETWVGGSGIKSDFINPLTFTAGTSDDILRLDPIQDVTRGKVGTTEPDTKGVLTGVSETKEEEDEEGNDMDYYSYGNPTEPGDVLKPYSKYAQGGTVMNSPLMAAAGGVPHKGSHYVQGDGGGQDDLIDAKLADGEYVFDADIVAALGDGSNKRGAEILDKFRQQIRKHKRSASRKEIPPAAKSPLAYLKEVTS
jgi:hypothetical protein